MIKYTVYKTKNIINNKIYVGVHKTENINDEYIGSGLLLKAAIKKYGEQNFVKDILFSFDNAKDAFDKEKIIVNERFIKSNETYNLAKGGSGGELNNKGRKHSDATKKLMSDSAKNISKVTRDLRSIAATGRVFSKESNRKKGNKKSLNGNAKRVCIYNFDGLLYCESNGNFKEMCKKHNLPSASISKLLRNNGGILYENSNMKNIKEDFKQFIGFKVFYK